MKDFFFAYNIMLGLLVLGNLFWTHRNENILIEELRKREQQLWEQDCEVLTAPDGVLKKYGMKVSPGKYRICRHEGSVK